MPGADRSSTPTGGMTVIKRKYRVVTDNYCGYAVQVWRWWLPIWLEAELANTHTTVEKAMAYAENHSRKVIRVLKQESSDE